jgi:hypothetical protein
MYTDPSLVREHTVKLSFNDREADLIEQAAGEQQVAVYAREAILRAIKRQMAERGLSIAPS